MKRSNEKDHEISFAVFALHHFHAKDCGRMGEKGVLLAFPAPREAPLRLLVSEPSDDEIRAAFSTVDFEGESPRPVDVMHHIIKNRY